MVVLDERPAPFACPECGRAFASGRGRGAHLRSHRSRPPREPAPEPVPVLPGWRVRDAGWRWSIAYRPDPGGSAHLDADPPAMASTLRRIAGPAVHDAYLALAALLAFAWRAGVAVEVESLDPSCARLGCTCPWCARIGVPADAPERAVSGQSGSQFQPAIPVARFVDSVDIPRDNPWSGAV